MSLQVSSATSLTTAPPSVVPQTRSVPQARSKVECFVARVMRGVDEDVGREISACAEPLAIGTSPGNRMVLNDGLVSRHHCELTSTPLGLHVRDLGSTNGT